MENNTNSPAAAIRPATNSQLWAIRCATKKDRRADNLSYDEAVAILAEANKGTKYDKSGMIAAPLAALSQPAPKKAGVRKTAVVKKKAVAPKAVSKAKAKAASDKLYEGLKGLLLKETSIEYLALALVGEMNIKSIVSNDTSVMKAGPRYIFMGGGCGFAWVKCRKSPKSDAIKEFAYELKRSYVDNAVLKFIKELAPNLLENCSKMGNPLQAHQMQNEFYNRRFHELVAQFMEKQGISAYADSRLD